MSSWVAGVCGGEFLFHTNFVGAKIKKLLRSTCIFLDYGRTGSLHTSMDPTANSLCLAGFSGSDEEFALLISASESGGMIHVSISAEDSFYAFPLRVGKAYWVYVCCGELFTGDFRKLSGDSEYVSQHLKRDV